MKQAEVCARYHINAGRSATSMVATDSVFDTSMNVEIVENRKALTTVRNKKKELKDLDNHAYQAGSETSSNVVDALDSVDELETDLDQSKESISTTCADMFLTVLLKNKKMKYQNDNLFVARTFASKRKKIIIKSINNTFCFF